MPSTVELVQSLVNGVGVGLVYGLVGIGFCVIYNASGIVNFAQGVVRDARRHVRARDADPARPAACRLPRSSASSRLPASACWCRLVIIRPMWKRKAPLFAIILATLAVQFADRAHHHPDDGRPAAHLSRVHPRRAAEARPHRDRLPAVLDPRLRRADGGAAHALLQPHPRRARAARLLAEPRSRGSARHPGRRAC